MVEIKLVIYIVLLALGIFAVDNAFPLGVAASVPYIIVVILTAWMPRRHYVYLAGCVCTILTILGFFLSPPGGVQWHSLTNRTLTICTIWVTAALVLQRKRLESVVQHERDVLEQRVEQRTAELKAGNIRLQQEVANRRRAEETLQYQRDWLDVTLSSVGDAVIATDTNGMVTFINPIAENLTEWAAADAIGTPVQDVFRIIHEQSREPIDTLVSAVLQDQASISLSNHTVLIARHGREIAIADSAAPILNRHGVLHGVVLVFRDVTESQRLEAEVRHAHKMQAIGTLAGGIAHEFNNILAGILGFAELILQRVKTDTDIGQYVQSIHNAGLRAKELVQQILTFSHPTRAGYTLIHARELVNDSLQFIRASLPASIALEVNFATDAGVVRVNTSQIHQVILNLCANAIDAMRHQGGHLTIEVDTVHIAESSVTMPVSLSPGSYVRLSVQDNGPGIAPEVWPRIFEPFFTTKGVGEGTGMGLAIVHGIVTSHGGDITVESLPGEGTTVAVYLPQHSEPLPEGATRHEAHFKGAGRVLFVDDEEPLVLIAQQLLMQLGYQTHATTSSREALEMFRMAPDGFDLVITDLTMPDMTGITLMQELRQIRLDIPVIVCTGYSHVHNTGHIRTLGADALLQKPISGTELEFAIQRILTLRERS